MSPTSPKMLSPMKITPRVTCITNSPACLPTSTTVALSSNLGEIRVWRKLRHNARAAVRQQSTQLVKYVLLLEKTLCRMELTLPASSTFLQSRRRSHISRYASSSIRALCSTCPQFSNQCTIHSAQASISSSPDSLKNTYHLSPTAYPPLLCRRILYSLCSLPLPRHLHPPHNRRAPLMIRSANV